jgi:DNA polymerase III subunit epsilon
VDLSDITFVVIDFETVTPAGRRPEPIEVAAIAARWDDAAIVETGRFTALIRPPQDAPLTPFDIAQTGITPTMLDDAEPAKVVMDALDQRLTQPPYVLVAHNAAYEAGLIFDWREACPQLARIPLLDTVRLARVVYPDLAHHRLDDLIRHLDIPAPPDRHRALPDVVVTLAVFARLLQDGTWSGLAHLQSVSGIVPKAVELERQGHQETLFLGGEPG